LFNADFHGAKVCNIPGAGIAGVARKIAKSADKMLINLSGKPGFWPVAFPQAAFRPLKPGRVLSL